MNVRFNEIILVKNFSKDCGQHLKNKIEKKKKNLNSMFSRSREMFYRFFLIPKSYLQCNSNFLSRLYTKILESILENAVARSC